MRTLPQVVRQRIGVGTATSRYTWTIPVPEQRDQAISHPTEQNRITWHLCVLNQQNDGCVLRLCSALTSNMLELRAEKAPGGCSNRCAVRVLRAHQAGVDPPATARLRRERGGRGVGRGGLLCSVDQPGKKMTLISECIADRRSPLKCTAYIHVGPVQAIKRVCHSIPVPVAFAQECQPGSSLHVLTVVHRLSHHASSTCATSVNVRI